MIYVLLAILIPLTHADSWLEKRAPMIELLGRLKNHGPVDHLYPLLDSVRIDDTLWRWAMTDELPAARARATQLLGATEYSAARFSRLITEMERSIFLGEARAYDFMVAVAHMRANSAEAAAQMRARVRHGVPDSLRAHYYRARAEYELVPPGGEVDFIARELMGPSAEARELAFRDAIYHGSASEFGAPTHLISGMDQFLMMAPDAPLLRALELLRRRPRGFEALIERVVSLRIHRSNRVIKRAAARTVYRLRGGHGFRQAVGSGPALRQSASALRSGAHDQWRRVCEALMYK